MGELWWNFKQAAELSRYTSEQLQNATQWAVWTVDPSTGNTAGAGFDPYLPGSTISTLNADGMAASEVIAQLASASNVESFYPLIEGLNAVKTASPLDEPLFDSQWHLRNTGQLTGSPNYQDLPGVPGEDINVVGAWNLGYTGQGVTVGVIDSGYQTNHPDLSVNNNAGLGANFATGVGSHGTAVAGLIAANGNNNNGVVGVAYDASLVNIDIGTDQGLNLTSAVLNYRNDVIDIYNLSLGEGVDGRLYQPLDPSLIFALRSAVLFGRPDENGVPLGNIFVVASGNDGGTDFAGQGFATSGHWDSANYSGLVSSRYTIGVGAVNQESTYRSITDGTVTNYPEAGSSILVSAPTGSVGLEVGLDLGAGSGIWTTDLTGNNGYNSAGDIDGDFLDDTNYTSRFSGTSAATPMVSGVIALMLQANPNLTYRDVQEILVRSARQNNPTSESWQTNLFESWESPAVQVVPVDPMDPTMGLKVIPGEDPFLRDDIDPNSDIPLDPTRTIGSLFVLPPIDNYKLFQLDRFDNGAGYTVSDARGDYAEEYGWGHGVVDAELAVQLASQWTTKRQALAPELTYTTFVRPGDIYIPSAAKVGPDGADELYIIPGIAGGARGEGFHAYYDEFFADMPFDGDDPPSDDNGLPFPLTSDFLPGFDLPAMKVEWVEVKMTVVGSDLNDMRIALRSPDGTVSDLNAFIEQNDNISVNMNHLDQDSLRPGTDAPGEGTIVFSTNRHWGERSDSFTDVDPNTGQAITLESEYQRNWELIVENYGGSSATLDAFEVVFHGAPIGENTERILGHVGLDVGTPDNPGLANDGNFDFARGIDLDTSGDGITDTRVVDPDQEPFASNVTVTVHDVSDPDPDSIVDEFVTGADGNFYFDLAPGTYTVKAFAPNGYTLLQDTGLDPRYQEEWTVTINPNDDFTRTAGRGHVIDDDQDGIQDSLDMRYDYYNDVDFLLKADVNQSTDVTVSGFVFADVNGDGQFNGSDTEAKNFHVYADVNHSGAFEQGEPETRTSMEDADAGQYTIVVPGIDSLQNIVIVVEPVTSGWAPTKPIGGKQTLLQMGGGVATNVDFGFRPPLDSNGDGNAGDPGTIIGVVYSDHNSNGVQNTSDEGVSGVRVYVDANANGEFDYVDVNTNGIFDEGDTSEVTDVTNDFGGFFLAGVDPGIVRVRIVVPVDWVQTGPLSGFFQETLTDGGFLNNVGFGIRNLATRDFGDLPDTYKTTLAADGPRHSVISGFRLGARVDGETDGTPTAAANGDDLTLGDEDGVTLPGGSLVAGQANTVQVNVSGVGGYLNAWFDFDHSGTFESSEHVLIDRDLNPGTQSLTVNVPANLAPGPVAARFRWGTAGLDYYGAAIIGEVEDYFFNTITAATQSAAIPGDYDSSGTVDDADYDLWKSSYGSTSNLAADGNNDGVVNSADYAIWRNHYGQTNGGGGSASVAVETAASDPLIYRVSQVSSSTGSQLTADSPEYAALMQMIGATPVTYDLGARGTATIYTFSGSESAGGQASASSPSTSVASAAAAPVSAGQAGQQLMPFSTTASPRESTAIVRRHERASTDSSSADLLLVDRVLSHLGGDDDAPVEAAPLGEHARRHDDRFALALASAFEDDADWWTTL